MQKGMVLRGIAGMYPDPALGGKVRQWPHGALDEPPAIEYLKRRGCSDVIVLQMPGWTGSQSQQTQAALKAFRDDPTIEAIYGFSGGADNLLWLMKELHDTQRSQLKLAVAVGADHAHDEYLAKHFQGASWEVVFQSNPPQGHMYGPRYLLDHTPVIVTADKS